MIPQLGLTALAVAQIAALFQVFSPLSSRFTVRTPIYAAEVVFTSLTLAFGFLVYAFVASDFSVLTVAMNSHTMKPLIYKISGTWGNHEGSMLLFTWLLSLVTLLFAYRSRYNSYIIPVTVVQGILLLGLISYLIFTSNPFTEVSPVPENGLGLNPLLQDIALAMHPPMLYLGYVISSLALSFSVVALWRGKVDEKWAGELRPWVTTGWSLLTIGIALGSWWAYRELGWGGFWFWDPVENASLLPWLSATALLHSLIVLERRKTLKTWVLLLSILTFSLCLVGFFLVRSGVLTSVHSFASDPHRGMFILVLIGIIVGGAFLLYALRAHRFTSSVAFATISKESTLILNNILLVTLCLTVFIGTLYPLLLELATGERVSVGAPYFNAVFNPIALGVLFFAAIGPLLKWKGDKVSSLSEPLRAPFIVAILVTILTWYCNDQQFTLSAPALGFSAWLCIATLQLLTRRIDLFQTPPMEVVSKILNLPPSYLAMVVGHLGLAILVTAVTITVTWQEDKEVMAVKGQEIAFKDYNLILNDTKLSIGQNYFSRQSEFFVSKGSKSLPPFYPETRQFPIEGQLTTESSIHSSVFEDLYLVTGELGPNESIAVRIFHRPMVSWIWIGALVIALGGFLSLVAQRRARD